MAPAGAAAAAAARAAGVRWPPRRCDAPPSHLVWRWSWPASRSRRRRRGSPRISADPPRAATSAAGGSPPRLSHPRVDGARRWTPAAPAHLPQGARLTLPPPVRQERRVQPLATQQGAHLAGLLARVDGLENAQPIRGREAPPLDRRRHLRAGNVVAGSGPPVALRAPSTPDPATTRLHRVWHARHLSNLSRPYTKLNREVVSQIIGTGGIPDGPFFRGRVDQGRC